MLASAWGENDESQPHALTRNNVQISLASQTHFAEVGLALAWYPARRERLVHTDALPVN